MGYREPFAIGEWYHCYNRGVDKRIIFNDDRDYDRFLLLSCAGNSSLPIQLFNIKDKTFNETLDALANDRGKPIVEVGAYCLMPNHFHLLLKEIQEGGITAFMQKVCTGYTMYFNKKNERTGALLAGPFKSKHVKDDVYVKRLVSYIHLNPVELKESGWKQGKGNIVTLQKWLLEYRYSSMIDFFDTERPERKVIGMEIFDLFDTLPTLKEMLEDAQAYYEEKALAEGL